MRISIEELARVSGGRILFGHEGIGFDNITTASGKIKGNDLFVPVIGEKTDGHLYIRPAFENGAEMALTQEPEVEAGLAEFRDTKGLVLVDSTVRALQQFAAYMRETHFTMPFIGVTGSVGKTTTREMIAAALRSGKRVYTTKGNANSQVGVPITVFETEEDAELAVVELGISDFGEMEQISSICSVETAVMTNIGISHMAQFGTQQNILLEKLHILSEQGPDICLILNGDDPILRELTEESIHRMGIALKRKITIRRYGMDKGNDYRTQDIRKENGYPSFDLVLGGKSAGIRVSLSVPGDHMIMNALAALAVCDRYGLDLRKAAASLGDFTGFEGRGNRIERNGYTIINDSYNASPASVKSGLSVLADMTAGGRKIAVLGDMRELGDQERQHHLEVGRYIAENMKDLDLLYTYGELAALIGDPVEKAGKIRVQRYLEFEALQKDLEAELKPGDILFVKGSLTMGLGRLIK